MKKISLALVTLLCMTSIGLAQNADQQYGGLCGKCNRQFSISSNQLQNANTAEILINPSEWGLRNGMTQDEVKSVLGEPLSVKNATPFTWWFYPDNKRVEFAQFSKDTKCRLYFCSVLGSNITTAGQPSSIKCPYCGFEQDTKTAINRYAYALQRQQQYASQQRARANQQLASGASQAPSSSFGQTYMENANNYLSYLRQQAQSSRPSYYQTITTQQLETPRLPRSSNYQQILQSMEFSRQNRKEYDVYSPGTGITHYEVTGAGYGRADVTASNPRGVSSHQIGYDGSGNIYDASTGYHYYAMPGSGGTTVYYDKLNAPSGSYYLREE